MKVMVVGDVHAEWACLNELLNKKKPDITLACGDFGFWPGKEIRQLKTRKITKIWPPKLNLQGGKLYWCPGNHEDWWEMERLYGRHGREPIEIINNLYYCPIGSVLTLEDERKVMFIGGADSIDKAYRRFGFDWFPNETLGQIDFEFLQDTNVDIVVSHTCPESFDVEDLGPRAIYKADDPSKIMLERILDRYKPSLWYFGHYHYFAKGEINKCRWFAMAESGHTNWWRWIDK